MKQRPILFSTAMVQAILAGRKTQTRRTTKLDIANKNPNDWILDGAIINNHFILHNKANKHELWINSPYGLPGDVLWVRETWTKQGNTYKFLSDNLDWKGIHKFKPSIHMPKEACRIWLEITSVKIERLMKISQKEAISEGIEPCGTHGYKNYLSNEPMDCFVIPCNSFISLWESINGKDSWLQNPWVWVIEFKQIQKPE